MAAEKLRVRIDWFSFLTKRSLIRAIRGLELINATVRMAKDASGQLEVKSLLPPTDDGLGDKVPRITIELKNCRLQMEMTEEEWSWGDFQQIDGLVDLRSYPRIWGNVQAVSLLDPEADAGVELSYVGPEKSGELKIKAEKAQAAIWGAKVLPLLGYDQEFRVESGALDGEVLFRIEQKRLKLASTRLQFHDARWAVAALPYPLEKLAADLTIAPTGIEIRRLSTQYRHGQIKLNGKLATTLSAVDLDLYAASLNLADWTSLFPELKAWQPTGTVDLNLQVTGKLRQASSSREMRMNGEPEHSGLAITCSAADAGEISGKSCASLIWKDGLRMRRFPKRNGLRLAGSQVESESRAEKLYSACFLPASLPPAGPVDGSIG